MGKYAIRAFLDDLPVFFDELGRAWARGQKVHGAIAKEAVQLFDALMTRIVAASFIGKESRRIFHKQTPFQRTFRAPRYSAQRWTNV